MKRLSLRARLSFGYTLFFAVVLLLLGAGVYLAVQRTLLREITMQLAASADLIQHDFIASNSAINAYFTDPAFLLRTHPPQVEGLDSAALYVDVRTLNGANVVTSSSLKDQLLPLDQATLYAVLGGQAREQVLELNGARVYVRTQLLRDANQPVGVLQVGQPLRELDQTLLYLLVGLLSAGIVALITANRGGAWLAERALRPVEEVVEITQQIVRAEDLVRRVPIIEHDDEIGRLTTTINDLLARLETLFESQRRFVADVSHELRTPLAAMRGHLEIMQRGATDDREARRESLSDMAREVDRLTRMTTNLLLLSQADAGLQLRHEPVALDELLLEVVRELRPLAQGITVVPNIAEQVQVIGDRDRIKQALLNLTANAVQYTPAGGSVRLELERADETALIHVHDTGSGIAAEQLPHLFERFYRVDPMRARHSGGAGLGLAIVKWIAEAHGGRVTVSSAPGRGSTFTLILPLSSSIAPSH